MAKAMAKAILRTEKLKSVGNIVASLSHNYRTRETPNADPTRTLNNLHDIASAKQAADAIRKRIPLKHRSDAVLCIEYLITASPEYFNSDDDPKGKKYFELAKKWLIEKHGEENVITTSIHHDETTPHLVAYVVPVVDGVLNAKKFLGGRKILSEMQTDFHNKAGRPCNLERGEIGSKATHTTIKQYYSRLNKIEDLTFTSSDITYSDPTLLDKAKTANYGHKVASEVADQFEEKLKVATTKLNEKFKAEKEKLDEKAAFYMNEMKISKQKKVEVEEKLSTAQTKIQSLTDTIERLEGLVSEFQRQEKIRKEILIKAKFERDELENLTNLMRYFEPGQVERAKSKRSHDLEKKKREQEEAQTMYQKMAEEKARLQAEVKAAEAAKKAEQARLEAEIKEKERLEEATFQEYKLLRKKWWDKDIEKLREFSDTVNTTEMSPAECLAALKAAEKVWEEQAKRAKQSNSTEETQEIRKNPRDDYDSPSPF